MSIIQQSLDSQAFVAAMEGRDADTLAAAYAEDAVITIFDRDHPPASPLTLSGREEIHRWYRDACGRNIEHHVSALVTDAGGFAYVEECRYPEGNAVVCVAVATLTGGLITSQTGSQTWD
jgi:ketosteroid isomerase-like protein